MQQYWSCAGLHPPKGTFQGMVLDTDKEEGPYSASPDPWMDGDECEGVDEEDEDEAHGDHEAHEDHEEWN